MKKMLSLTAGLAMLLSFSMSGSAVNPAEPARSCPGRHHARAHRHRRAGNDEQ